MRKGIALITFMLLFLLIGCNQAEPEEKTYTYVFETNGGSTINDIILSENQTLTLPSSPTKDGYTFSGWYFDENAIDLPYDINQLNDYIMDDTLTLYAKWEKLDVYHEISWQMPDGTILKTDSVLENTMPVYDGTTPYINPTDLETYTFTGWTPTIAEATENQVYIATFETQVIEKPTFNPNDLNNLFGYNIYQFIPEITSDDYEIFDYSHENYIEIYIDVLTWNEQDSFDYMDALDVALPYDDIEESWILDDYYVYVYEDTFSYPNDIVFGIGIYGEINNTITYDSFLDVIDEVHLNFNDSTLKTLMPNFTSVEALSLLTQHQSSLEFNGIYTGSNSTADQNAWINNLTTNGFIYNQTFTDLQQKDVYTYEISNDLSYAIIFEININELYLKVWSFDPTIDLNTLDQIDYVKTINNFELEEFGKSGLPSKGTFDVLVIPIEFSEQPFPSDYKENLELIFNGTPEATGWHSVSSYYTLSSYGLLNMSFDILDKYETTLSKAFIESKGGDGDQYAIVDALSSLDPTFDFSKYDTNDDGLIDSIYFIYSVDFDYEIEPWWAWVYAAKHGEAAQLPKLDGLDFEYYTWISYGFSNEPIEGSDGQVVNAETFIHETGHLFGGIDLYSYTEDYGPFGSLGMMDYNNGDHDPIHKLLFGWTKPYVADTGVYDVTLESYALDDDGIGSTVIIPYDSESFDDGDAFDEFIIIMFYTPEGLYNEHLGLDYMLKDAGVMIYHVDARLYQYPDFWDTYFMYNNDGKSDFFSSVLEVDDNDSLDYSTLSKSDILTSGSTDLSNYSWHQGGSINIQIELLTMITNDSDEITFRLTIN